MTVATKPRVIVLTGASGAGKTTILHELQELKVPHVECINCDRVNPELTDSEPSDRQAAILRHWLAEIERPDKRIDLAVLDTQIRPHRAFEVLAQEGFDRSTVILVDCEPEKRNERLRTERQQHELITHQMDCWAAYLRGQADALNLPVIDTSSESVQTSLEQLLFIVKKLDFDHQ